MMGSRVAAAASQAGVAALACEDPSTTEELRQLAQHDPAKGGGGPRALATRACTFVLRIEPLRDLCKRLPLLESKSAYVFRG